MSPPPCHLRPSGIFSFLGPIFLCPADETFFPSSNRGGVLGHECDITLFIFLSAPYAAILSLSREGMEEGAIFQICGKCVRFGYIFPNLPSYYWKHKAGNSKPRFCGRTEAQIETPQFYSAFHTALTRNFKAYGSSPCWPAACKPPLLLHHSSSLDASLTPLGTENCRLICYLKTFSRRLI